MDATSRAQMVSEVMALMRLLEQQRALYRKLRVLSDQQRTLVLMDDHQPLLNLLAERQRLVDGLVSLVGQMTPYRQRWTQLYRDMDDDARRQVKALLEEVNSSLGSILQSDGHDTATLEARKEAVADQLSTVTMSRRATAAYANAGSTNISMLADAEA